MNKLPFTLLFAITPVSTVSMHAAPDRRIKFARARTSPTVGGNFAWGGSVCHVAAAQTGPTLTATIRSRTGRAHFFESGETSHTLTVEQPGDQSICVYNL